MSHSLACAKLCSSNSDIFERDFETKMTKSLSYRQHFIHFKIRSRCHDIKGHICIRKSKFIIGPSSHCFESKSLSLRTFVTKIFRWTLKFKQSKFAFESKFCHLRSSKLIFPQLLIFLIQVLAPFQTIFFYSFWNS